MKKIILTGGTGFLGGELLEQLKNKYYFFSIYRNKKGLEHKNIRWIKTDLSNEKNFIISHESLKKEKIDFVIHAGGSTPNRAYKEGNYNATINGTKYLIELSKELGIKKIIFISSISVTFPKKGPYANSKITAENLIKNSGIKYAILRPETIIGKNALDFNRLAKNLRTKKFFPIIGLGNNLNQPISSKNLIEIIRICLESRKTDNRTYSVFGKEKITTREFMKKIAQIQGNKIILIPVPKFLAYLVSIMLNFINPRLGLNPERINITSFSKKYNETEMKDFNISFLSFEEMISFLKFKS